MIGLPNLEVLACSLLFLSRAGELYLLLALIFEVIESGWPFHVAGACLFPTLLHPRNSPFHGQRLVGLPVEGALAFLWEVAVELADLEWLLGSQDAGRVEHAVGCSWCLWESTTHSYQWVWTTLAGAKVLPIWVSFWCPHFR